MENADEDAAGENPASPPENPNPRPVVVGDTAPTPAPPSRTPFTSLSQVDADLALARRLQEQERAYMMLMMNGGHGGHYTGLEFGSDEDEDEDRDGDEGDGMHDLAGEGHDHLIHDDDDDDDDGDDDGCEEDESDYEEDAFDANEERIDPAAFDSDEAYARALQEAEEREVAVRLMAMAGLDDYLALQPFVVAVVLYVDTWEKVDPDELSYEELVALGEVVGTESRGLSADSIASLPSISYKAQSGQDSNNDQCVICRLDYEDGESLVLLSCKHAYHSECINRWLQINKVCPVCSAEVSTSVDKQD
ncbi:E3 ubiquitin ligase BIG BROTHER-related-like [Dioscorea cayenensis subsp. rotundata]|uniref:E3 ubiquitin ligase BIG BROTHER-related-like n=1 Tax=Dioscorea cayennensis subsp. rotundata TaxID=55577 RepID=A0AB40C635_DIOCR|nr:E3 ubiquitin ligase BIG BROTHER-related-like [Dioscorea cayenensis subsp. rotundata]